MYEIARREFYRTGQRLLKRLFSAEETVQNESEAHARQNGAPIFDEFGPG